MSRIHDALKRAEEEKNSHARLQEPQPARPAGAVCPEATATSPAAEPEPPAPRNEGSLYDLQPWSFESFAGRCRQPAWKPDPSTMLFFQKENHQYDTEVFRTLRSRLDRIRDSLPLRSLLVTSTLPAEGKSFVAANLAQVIAQQHGRRALLIDADLRQSRLHVPFGAPPTPGLSDYLLGQAQETEVIQRGPTNNLFFLPGGEEVTNPVELISNGRLRGLFDHMAAIFDWIIVDSPPMIPVSDASLLADLCDGVLLVVKAAATPFDLAQKARAEIGTKPVVGVVLNNVGPGASYGAAYYGYYGSKTEK